MAQSFNFNWVVLGFTAVVFFLYFRSRRRSLSYLRGPPRNSKLFGRELDLLYEQDVGDLEFKWVEEYGTAFPVPNCYGQDTLFICDPRALQYVLQTSEYKYPRPADLKFLLKGFLGSGIIFSEGSTHQRQRKILNPAFSGEHLRQFLTDFQAHTNRLVKHIDDEVTSGKETIDMAKLLPKLTLDIIGDTGFRYRFGALEDEITELSHKFLHLFDDSKRITEYQLLSNALRRYLPPWVSEMTRLAPTKEELRFADFHRASSKLAEAIINQKGRDLVDPARGTDILDILHRSNNSEDPKKRMSDHEVFSQLATLLLAGHETTASTTGWLLYELCKHPEDQQRIVNEIQEIRRTKNRGAELHMSDYASAPYLNAVVKEALRFHPIIPGLWRTASEDDVIPLQIPVISRTGETITRIPIKKGQRIDTYFAAYNRLPQVWGDDANQWNPSRFLRIDSRDQTAVGPFFNLCTFSAGPKSCLGFRFGVTEVRAIIVGLLEAFEFSLPEGGLELQKLPGGGILHPMVRGKLHEGPSLPLVVKLRMAAA
ncbi:cytochrome P450 [Marasmius fiardii PR-910]|nr:cytochrome P450 [Marasmius fiardii PR-910]